MIIILLDKGMCPAHTKIAIIECGVHIGRSPYDDCFFTGGIRYVVPVNNPNLIDECAIDFNPSIHGGRTVIVETFQIGDVGQSIWECFGTVSPHGDT